MADATARDAATTVDISSEEYRRYTYPDGSSFTVRQPLRLTITGSGSHRVEDMQGETHRPSPNYIAISWKPKAGAPAFVA